MADDEYAYLDDNFNSRTLRKDKLRNILITHGVDFSNDMLKPKLLDLFEREIVPRRAELRTEFVDVKASSSNIENATPPRTINNTSTRLAPAPDQSDANPPKSPRSRGRSRSPRKTTKKSPVKEDTDEPAPIASEPLASQSIPDLAPPIEQIEAQPPKTPGSPRRRRAVRKVELPSDNDTKDLPVPTGDVKLKATRSPRKKRVAESQDVDESFSSANVFQKGHSAKKARVDREIKPESPGSSHVQAVSNQPVSSQPALNQPVLNQPVSNQTVPNQSIDTLIPPVSETDIGYDLPLDADLVAEMNAEMDRYEHQSGPEIATKFSIAETPNILPETLNNFESEPERFGDVSLLSQQQEASTLPAEPEVQPKTQENDKHVPKKTPRSRGSQKPEAAAVSRPSKAQPAPEPRRRRGFMPSIGELKASREFAEQLEPFMVPTPVPTPRSQTPHERGSRADTPQYNTTFDGDFTDFGEAEEIAAQGIHDVLENLPRPKLPQLQLPDVRIPEVNMPEIHLPEVRLPAVRVPRFHIPRPRLPRIPRVPLPKIRLSHLKALLSSIFYVASFGLSACLIAIGAGCLLWYRDAYAQTEFCGIGFQSYHEYPAWTNYETKIEGITQLQEKLRDAMDATWPECIPCPENAHCYGGQIVVCDSGFSQSPSLVSKLGIWPSPPRCVPDWETQRKLDVLSERVVSYLRQSRADALCSHTVVADNEDDVLKLSALTTNQLKSKLLSEKSDMLTEAEFDKLWEEVVDLLPSKFSDVYVVSDPFLLSETVTFAESGDNDGSDQVLTPTQAERGDSSNEANSASSPEADRLAQLVSSRSDQIGNIVWLVSNSDAKMTLSCRFRRYIVFWVKAHGERIAIALVVSSLAIISYIWIRVLIANRKREQILVDKFISDLKEQRQLSAKDPTNKTKPYILTTELRRQTPRAIWPQIQTAVESNENVRARQIEVYGEIMRIWEWTR